MNVPVANVLLVDQDLGAPGYVLDSFDKPGGLSVVDVNVKLVVKYTRHIPETGGGEGGRWGESGPSNGEGKSVSWLDAT